ncbi:DUF1566 domain-containing protein [Patescibacteria group bacterium]
MKLIIKIKKNFYNLLSLYLVLVVFIALFFIGVSAIAQQEETPAVLKEYISGQDCPSFVPADTNNITVKDECTNLVWARRELPTYYEDFTYFDDNSLDPGYSWEQAKKACEEIAEINGQNIFRLPSVEELLTLMQYKCDGSGCSAKLHENYGLPFFSGGRFWTINDFNEPAAWRLENSRRDYKRSVSLRDAEVDSPVYNIDMRLNAWCVVARNPEIIERKFINVQETAITGGAIVTGGDLQTVYNRKCETDIDCDPPLTGTTCEISTGFCSIIDYALPVNLYNPITDSTVHVGGTPQQIIVCDPGYHVEGTICTENVDEDGGYWEGTETSGDYVWLPFLCPQNTIALDDGSCEVEWVYVNSDGIVFDSNTDSNTATEVGGEILKVGDVMPTPYIWIANSGLDQISKIRAYGGYKVTRAGIDIGVWENKGQLIGVYPLEDNLGNNIGDNPSRTAVNAETGDVWVANRNSANIHKLDIDGNFKKVCTTGGGPRGVAIERNGDVWVASYDAGNAIKISGADSGCTALATVSLGGRPYGLAIDSQNNLWVSNRGAGILQKVDTSTLVVTNFSLPYAGTACGVYGRFTYGITVDLNDDIWIADTCTGVWKCDSNCRSGAAAATHIAFSGFAHYTGASRGVTVDISGKIWIAMDYSNQVVKINDVNNPAGSYEIKNLSGYGSFPIGIAGDSMGQVWVVKQNYWAGDTLNYTDVNLPGGTIETFQINPYQGNIAPYTYSDMTGINRAMVLRSGVWYATYDKVRTSNIWGNVTWQESIPDPTQQSIEVYVEVSNSDTPTGNWSVDAATWNALPAESSSRQGRYLHIKTILRSSQRGVTPVLWDFIILP